MNTPDPQRKRVPQSLLENLIKNAGKQDSKTPGAKKGIPFTGGEMALAQHELEQCLDKSLHYLLTDGSHLISPSTKEWLQEMWYWTDKSSDLSEYLPLNLWPDWCRDEGVTC